MKRILICPLNWGIGHATRCMPIINRILDKGSEVQIATDGEALALLRLEYPELKTHELPSYSVRYPTKSIILNLSTRIPKIVKTIGEEKRRIAEIVEKEQIDVIISDNRFGCYHKECHSIFITHQINLISTNKLLDKLVRNFNVKRILKFNECWIPDFEREPGLSGNLAHGHKVPARYIGPISRMQKKDIPIKYEFAVVLSGPEPQRTYLESELLEKIKHTDRPICFVGGNFTDQVPQINNPNIQYYKLQNAEELNETYCASGFIICRSGYSSMMDLAVLGKKALIIPTPGQTEQEYLADIYKKQNWHPTQTQGKIDLQLAKEALKGYDGIAIDESNDLIDLALDEVIRVKSKV